MTRFAEEIHIKKRSGKTLFRREAKGSSVEIILNVIASLLTIPFGNILIASNLIGLFFVELLTGDVTADDGALEKVK